ncbi:MAG: 8-oxoguanine deaminase [Chloroflexota bacterium]
MDDDGTEHSQASIAVDDGWITYVGTNPPVQKYDATIDCARFVVLPGLVNTHHHLFQTLTRGFPLSKGQQLFSWLQMLYPIWAGLDEEMIYASTRTGLAELALSGCTTSSDHLYVFPAGSDAFMDASIEAASSIGVRFHPTRGSMDLGESEGGLPPDNVVQHRNAILKDSERVIDQYHDSRPGAMTRVGLAPCSPFSVSSGAMRDASDLARARSVRLHTHIAETLDEDSYSQERHGMSPVALLASLGWVGEDVWVAHCVHPSPQDIHTLSDTQTGIAHCPTSNMLLGSGLAPVNEFLRRSISVGLGVDGSASNDANDLRAEVKQAVLCARARDGASALSVRDALQIATRGGAACLGRTDIGALQPGKVADMAMFDVETLELAGGQEDLVAMIVLGAAKPHIVFVYGKTVVRDGVLVTADSGDISRRHTQQSRRLMERSRGKSS